MRSRVSTAKGTKAAWAISLLPCRRPRSGPNWNIIRSLLGVHSEGDKSRIGYLTPALSTAKKKADVLRNPCLLACPQQRGQKQKWVPHPAFSGAHKLAELLRNPGVLGWRQQRVQNENWQPHPCLLGGPQLGKAATQPLRSRGSPAKGRKAQLATSLLPPQGPTSGWNCYATPPVWGVPNKGDAIRIDPHPCLVGGPQVGGIATKPLHSLRSPTKGTKSEMATSKLPFWGLTGGQNCYVTPAFSGVASNGDKIRIGYLTSAFSRGPQVN